MWVGFANIISRLFTLIASVVTARILYPEDFGIIAMAATISSFVDFTSNMGIDAFIISRSDISKKQINSIFIINLLVAFLLGLLLILSAPLASYIYKSPEIKNILFFAGFSFFASTFSIIPKALLIKEMKQEVVSKIEIFKNLMLSALVILFAVSGFKYMSYVIPFLITNIIVSLFYIVITKWKFTISFDFTILKNLLNYTKNFFGKSIIMYFVLNSDYIIAGYLLGKSLLGYYYFGFEKTLIILLFIFNISNNIYFPVFSKHQHNYKELKTVFYSLLQRQTMILYPVFFMLTILSPEIFNLLFGNRWNNSIIIFQILMLMTFSRSISLIIHTLFDATGRPDLNFKYYAAITPIFILLFLLGAHYGSIIGLAFSVLLSYNFGIFLLFKQMDKVYEFGFLKLIKNYLKPLIPLLLQLPAIIPFKLLLTNLNVNKIIIIILISILSVILYFIFVRFFMREEYNNFVIPFKDKIMSKINPVFGDKELWKKSDL